MKARLCDRCGALYKEREGFARYNVTVRAYDADKGRYAIHGLDLCDKCNAELITFMEDKNATDNP